MLKMKKQGDADRVYTVSGFLTRVSLAKHNFGVQLPLFFFLNGH